MNRFSDVFRSIVGLRQMTVDITRIGEREFMTLDFRPREEQARSPANGNDLAAGVARIVTQRHPAGTPVRVR